MVVKRCGGACGNGRLRCIAAETRNTTFYVKTKMGLSISCSSIAVPEDTRCSCGCERTECPGAQYYDEDLCRCVCPVSVEGWLRSRGFIFGLCSENGPGARGTSSGTTRSAAASAAGCARRGRRWTQTNAGEQGC